MPTLRQRLFDRLAAAVTVLREPGCARRNFDQGAARACNAHGLRNEIVAEVIVERRSASRPELDMALK